MDPSPWVLCIGTFHRIPSRRFLRGSESIKDFLRVIARKAPGDRIRFFDHVNHWMDAIHPHRAIGDVLARLPRLIKAIMSKGRNRLFQTGVDPSITDFQQYEGTDLFGKRSQVHARVNHPYFCAAGFVFHRRFVQFEGWEPRKLETSQNTEECLPGGVSIQNVNGACSMTTSPAAGVTGTATITVTATDAVGASAGKTFTLAVQAAATSLSEGFDAA